jgi:hypothetical protein
MFVGQEIVAAPRVERDSFPWRSPLAVALRDADPGGPVVNLEEVRDELGKVAGGFLPTGLPSAQFGVPTVSDLVRFNRVEGFSFGMARWFGADGGRNRLSLAARYAVADRGFQGRAAWEHSGGSLRVRLVAESWIVDIGDEPVVSGLTRSLLAQEAGNDLGDYVRKERLGIRVEPGAARARFSVGVQRAIGLVQRATPVTGTFRPNQFLASEWWLTANLRLAAGSRAYGLRKGATGDLNVESGVGEPGAYVRLRAGWQVRTGTGPGELRFSGWAGLATSKTPAYRSFVLGGWGTIPGETFRRWGGFGAVFGRLEWGVRVPLGPLPLGGLAAAGSGIYVAPVVALGWTDRPPAGSTWRATGNPRLAAGFALEPFGGLLRVELVRNFTEGEFGITVDLARELWGIL